MGIQTISLVVIAACVQGSPVVIAACVQGSPSLTDEDVRRASNLIRDTLKIESHDELFWEPEIPANGWLSKHRGGNTAITTLALLESGEPPTSELMGNALEYLWKIEHPGTYVLAIRTSIWASLSPQFDRRLQSDVDRLVSSMNLKTGGWGASRIPPNSIHDTSPLQRELCVMALRESMRSGAKIPLQCWGSIAEVIIRLQLKDGGWSSLGKSKSTQNMTIAGLNCLLSVGEAFGGSLDPSDTKLLHESISHAIHWLQKNVNHQINYGGTSLMSYFFALERAAMSCGLTELDGVDWFNEGVQSILNTHCKKTKAVGSNVNLAFALLFLSRGHASITISELGKDKAHIHPHRISDVLTTRLSQFAERSLSWQLVTTADELETWNAAPFLFIQELDLLENNTSKIQQYVESGGTVVLLMGGTEIKNTKLIVEELAPTLKMEQTDNKHWSKKLLKKGRGIPVTVWNDGIRDCILLIQGSKDTIIRKDQSSLSNVLFNICMATAEFGGWRSKMWTSPTPSSNHNLIIATHHGEWDYGLQGFEHWGYELKPLEEIRGVTVAIVGSRTIDDASKELAKQITEAARSGATIVVESIGGKSHFAQKILELVFASEEKLVEPVSYANDMLGFRGMTRFQSIPLEQPLTISIGDGRVIFVDGDLRHSLMGQLAWGIHGYDMHNSMQFVDAVLENAYPNSHIE